MNNKKKNSIDKKTPVEFICKECKLSGVFSKMKLINKNYVSDDGWGVRRTFAVCADCGKLVEIRTSIFHI